MVKVKKIKFKERERMRYEDVGDYYFDKRGNLNIVVYKKLRGREKLGVMIHELVESLLTLQWKIRPRIIDMIDGFEGILNMKRRYSDREIKRFEKMYNKAHSIANSIERKFLKGMFGKKFNWKKYEGRLYKMDIKVVGEK